MPSWPTYRTVVYDERAQGFIDANTVPGERFEDQWRGAEWLICRAPEKGLPRDKQVPTKFVVLVIAGSAEAGTKELWLLYSFEDNEVTVHAVSFGLDE
jgi:hypothetical protein